MTVEPVIYPAAVILSQNWYRANPRGWWLTLHAARVRGVTLLDVIRDRYLAVRDDVAREAFDRQGETCVIAWERAQELAGARGGNESVAKFFIHKSADLLASQPVYGDVIDSTGRTC